MNTTPLKKYAPNARREFIRAVSDKAATLGITEGGIADVELDGDVALAAGRAFPVGLLGARNELARLVRRLGCEQVMEAMAYTWFNRLVALRYMELHELLDNGGGRCFRALSNRSAASDIPEIVEHATELALPGLDRATLIALRLAGDRDEELYGLLLKAQCNALARVMPGLFVRIDDATMLLIPANLLHSDSPLRKLVREIDEELWGDVEIIGWLYQFYISEKKDQVIGKVVKSEDIPAATQLFTPNWIVKYMVQNTLGRAWLATYPASGLRDALEFYIEPAQQTDEVQAELDAITPRELDPERLTFLDPACGSGHILAEAYDLLTAIYRECGRRPRDIPRLILEKNLYGLDIDDRAAQLARFTVLMKAAADDPRILDPDAPPRLNIYALQSSQRLDAQAMADAFLRQRYVIPVQRHEEQFTLLPAPQPPQQAQLPDYVPELTREELGALLALFEQAKTFGSLIIVPEAIAAALPKFERLLTKAAAWDPSAQSLAEELEPLVLQAKVLAKKYDFVVTNPPYMGNKGMNADLIAYGKRCYVESCTDLCSMFIERCLLLNDKCGCFAMLTMQSWMFLSSYEKLRSRLFKNGAIQSMIHLGARAFESFGGEIVSTSAFSFVRNVSERYKGSFLRIITGQGREKIQLFQEKVHTPYAASGDDFAAISGQPIAYWASENTRSAFKTLSPFRSVTGLKAGLSTGDNVTFQRLWHEVAFPNIGFSMNTRYEAKRSGLK